MGTNFYLGLDYCKECYRVDEDKKIHIAKRVGLGGGKVRYLIRGRPNHYIIGAIASWDNLKAALKKLKISGWVQYGEPIILDEYNSAYHIDEFIEMVEVENTPIMETVSCPPKEVIIDGFIIVFTEFS